MAKDFKAYSDLWLTSNEWYMNYDKWQTGPWEELDADQVEIIDTTAIQSRKQRFYRTVEIP